MVTRGLYFDTATLYYRAFFAVPESMTSSDGKPNGAIKSFLDMISTLYGQFPATHVVFAWDDDWRPQWRVDLVPTYKTHRVTSVEEDGQAHTDMPDALSIQVDAIGELLDAIGLPRIGQEGFEADDILGSLVTQLHIPADVVSGDRDLLQLVDDSRRIRMISITKGIRNLEVMTDDAMMAKYGVAGHQYADFALLRGDSSDGLPGVRGIGEKSATTLIAQFGNLNALIAALDDLNSDIPQRMRTKLEDGRIYMNDARPVVRTRNDAHLPKDLTLPKTVRDPDMVQDLVLSWGIERNVDRLLKALSIN